jgi:hypothetical protein
MRLLSCKAREAFALVEAVFEGTPVNYCPFIFVDNGDRARLVPRISEEAGQRLPNAVVFRPQPGSGASHEGKSFRRKSSRRTESDWRPPVSNWRRRSETPPRCTTVRR